VRSALVGFSVWASEVLLGILFILISIGPVHVTSIFMAGFWELFSLMYYYHVRQPEAKMVRSEKKGGETAGVERSRDLMFGCEEASDSMSVLV